MLSQSFFGVLWHSGHSAAIAIYHVCVLFVARHWLTGMANAAVTVLVGLGLLRLASLLRPLSERRQCCLRLRRFVFLVALFKGAFGLTVGDSLSVTRNRPLGIGLELPPPQNVMWSDRFLHYSIWHGTPLSAQLSWTLGGLALMLLIWRGWRIASSSRILNTLNQLSGETNPRVDAALHGASTALRFSRRSRLPKVILVEARCAT